MRPFHVSAEEILADEGSGGEGAQTACEGTNACVAQLMTLAFILPQEPSATGGRLSAERQLKPKYSPVDTFERTLVKVGTDMDQDVVSTLVHLLATCDVAPEFLEQFALGGKFPCIREQPAFVVFSPLVSQAVALGPRLQFFDVNTTMSIENRGPQINGRQRSRRFGGWPRSRERVRR